MICTILGLNWIANDPEVWALSNGQEWRFDAIATGATFDLQPFLQAATSDIQTQLWQDAAQSYLGTGLALGADLRPLRAATRALRRQGKSAEAGLQVVSERPAPPDGPGRPTGRGPQAG